MEFEYIVILTILITTLEDRGIISKRYFVHFKKVVLFRLTTYQSWVSIQFCSQNWYVQWLRIVSIMSHALHSFFQGWHGWFDRKQEPNQVVKKFALFHKVFTFSNQTCMVLNNFLHTRRAFQLGCFESFYLNLCRLTACLVMLF